MSHKQFDVICVGDVVTDAFIKLLDDEAMTYENEKGSWLAMPFGMKIPFERSIIVEGVGNAPNASVSFERLGLQAGLISNVGDDVYGREMITSLQRNGVDVRYIHVNAGKKSNYHYVLWYKEERTILIKHEEYDYHWPHIKHDEIPKWIYFSSISKNAMHMHDEISDWLNEHPEVKFAFQPGTFQIDMGIERLGKLYSRADLLVLNREEAAEVTKGNHDDVHDLLNKLHEIGVKIAVVTDGPAGAYASDGQSRFKMPPYPDPAPPKERTGAGDSFASTFVAAIVKGNNIEGALQWAPINSMNVVQHIGAQEGLLTEAKIEEFLQHAPDWYRPETF